MNAVNAVWTNGRILPSEPVDWPEGVQLRVEPVTEPGQIGLDESNWSDSPQALADWEAWVKTIEPLEFTEEEEQSLERYREQVRQFNIEAVRRQMATGEF